jgi:hypothetical protein
MRGKFFKSLKELLVRKKSFFLIEVSERRKRGKAIEV